MNTHTRNDHSATTPRASKALGQSGNRVDRSQRTPKPAFSNMTDAEFIQELTATMPFLTA